MTLRPTVGLAFLAMASCATAQFSVPPVEATKVERSLVGQTRFLRVSMYSTPFFGDATKKLLTAVPPEEVELLTHPDGSAVNPGRVETIFPVGTAVRILSVEYPSAGVMAQRMLFTPRTLAWVTVEVAAGPRNAKPSVLVLRPGLANGRELVAELERYLAEEDPSRALEAFPESIREAIKTKTATTEMTAEALEMAWGYPEQKRYQLVNAQRKETWKWQHKRWAELIDGRVTALSDESAPR